MTPDSNTPPDDYSQYAQIMQQSMAAALANVDAMQAEVRKTQEAALDELAAARETRQQIEAEARNIAEQQVEAYYLEIKEKIQQQTLRKVTESLLNAGRAPEEIQTWLDVQPEFVEEVQMQIRDKSAVSLPPWWFDMDELDATKNAGRAAFRNARVSYEQEGRGGTVIFQQDDIILRFSWEFGGGKALALIFVPSAETWENETGLPLERRESILDFVGWRVIADQGGARYVLSDDILEILK